MVTPVGMIVSIVIAVFASTGFWAFITERMNRKDTKQSAEGKMLKGLGHDRICYLAKEYIDRGFITSEEYENLYEYLYKPYMELGGNGTAEKLVSEVNQLPTHKTIGE